MHENKRGLSTIIVTLIIILISLIAIGIFWVVINNLIKGSSENIGLQKLTLSAEIKGVNIDNSSNNVTMSIKRNVGEGDLVGMKFVFYNNSYTEIISETLSLNQLEERRFVFHLSMNVSTLVTISIVPIFSSATGEENVGNIADSFNVRTGKRIEIPSTGNQTCTPFAGNLCAGRVCGSVQNGTCGTLNCAPGCSGGQTCNSSGQCVSACVPTTCAALGHNCGTWSDGCTGNLSCGIYGNGSCQSGYNCVAGTCVMQTAFTCGNNLIEPGEACDGTNRSGYVCATVGAGFRAGGTLTCSSDCKRYITTSCLTGNTINATSCSQANVQSAINSAVDGDIVNIPAGNCVWNTDSLVDGWRHVSVYINEKNVLLRGAGAGKTNITLSYPLLVKGINTKPFRISNFSFYGTGDTITVIGTSKNFRIDYCKFMGPYAVVVQGDSYGLIDHCYFNSSSDGTTYVASDNSAWNKAEPLGTASSVYFENCIFNSTGTNGPAVTSSNDGARYVLRKSSLYRSSLDAHGYCEHADPARSTYSYEIYDNIIIESSSIWTTMHLRGGTGVVFNNTITGIISGAPILLRDYRGSASDCASCAGGCCTTYPCRDQIFNFYSWDNTVNGVDYCTDVFSDNAWNIQQNRDYFCYENPNYAPYAYPHPLTLIN